MFRYLIKLLVVVALVDDESEESPVFQHLILEEEYQEITTIVEVEA